MVGIACVGMVLCATAVWWLISSLSSGYEITDGRVYFRSYNNVTWKVERKEVKGANAAKLKTIRRSGGLYATDGARVYFEGIVLSNAAPESFQVLDWRGQYSCDSQKAYWTSIPFSDDPENLEVLSRSYTRDRTNVYFASKTIEGADPTSFVVDDEVIRKAHDKNHRYTMGRRVED